MHAAPTAKVMNAAASNSAAWRADGLRESGALTRFASLLRVGAPRCGECARGGRGSQPPALIGVSSRCQQDGGAVDEIRKQGKMKPQINADKHRSTQINTDSVFSMLILESQGRRFMRWYTLLSSPRKREPRTAGTARPPLGSRFRGNDVFIGAARRETGLTSSWLPVERALRSWPPPRRG